MSPLPVSSRTYTQIIIDPKEMNFNSKIKLPSNTIFLYEKGDASHFALIDKPTDLRFAKAFIAPLSSVGELASPIAERLQLYREAGVSILEPSGEDKAVHVLRQRALKVEILALFHQLIPLLEEKVTEARPQVNHGGLVGLVGNHDVGTLKAKILLDIAYSRAMSNAGTDGLRQSQFKGTYEEFKSAIIKGVRDDKDLLSLLQSRFELSELDLVQLKLDTNVHMREKIFIQAMMCFGGWYSLAGDEVGICQKPEVFEQFARDTVRLGAPIRETSTTTIDSRGFIKGVNAILSNMPRAHCADHASMYHGVIEHGEYGKKAANFLFMVVRYSKNEDKYYLIGHTDWHLPMDLLSRKILELLAGHPCLFTGRRELYMVDQAGHVAKIRMDSEVVLMLSDVDIPRPGLEDGPSAAGVSLVKAPTFFTAPPPSRVSTTVALAGTTDLLLHKGGS